jgi:outer membrane protein TolC
VPNLAYVTYSSNVASDLRTFHEIVPFRRLAALVSEATLEAVPALRDKLERAAAGVAEVEIVPVGSRAAPVLEAIPEGVDAVYVGPLLQLGSGELRALADGLVERRLPSFALLGRSYVERGFLAGNATDTQFERLARRTALYAQRILLGEPASELPVEFPSTSRLSINMATARSIGVSPPWEILTLADQIDLRREAAPVIALEEAVREALVANRDLLSAELSVAAGEASVDVARSPLLPQVDLSADGTWIKPEIAEKSLGQTAERSITGTASVFQLLYDDDAWAGYSVEKSLQRGRSARRDAVRLDVAQAAAIAYLDVLRAKTIERIQRENLDRTRVNLELARSREAVGQSNPGEVYRWEGAIANQRIAVIRANSQRNLAEIRLNRILHRPLEQPYSTEEVDLRDPNVPVSDSGIARYLGDPASFRVLREFMSGVARENSPELRSLDASLTAQERVLTATGRSFWIPSVGLSGEVSHTFLREGEGSEPVPPLAGPEETQWFLGLRATYPLLEGGAKLARRREAARTLEEIRTDRESESERIEQRLRSALHTAGASLAAIGLAREAADAANRNFRLVQDSYSEGVVPIVDLIEAQSNSLVSEEQAANSVHDFLIDLMEVERAAGYLSYLSSPADRAAFVERLEEFRRERERQEEVRE